MMTDTYSSRTLTAFFDQKDDASLAVQRLRDLGIPEASIRLVGGQGAQGGYEEKGFWESLGDMFFPEEDRETYGEGLRRGGYLVTVTDLDPALFDEALDILDDEGTVDLEERSAAWRSEGWAGSAGAQNLTSAQNSTLSDAPSSAPTRDNVQVGQQHASRQANRSISDDEAIPIVEERLRVGKRDTNLGRVRVRSYVVEEPVQEQVTLRQERVRVERRPVDQELTGREDVFQDRVIEAEEHAEEAVIAKEARGTEEITLRKEADDRTESVSDTVRHTEVEVEDDRTGSERLTGSDKAKQLKEE